MSDQSSAKAASRKGSVMVAGAFPPPFIGPSVAMKQLISNPALHDQLTVHFLDLSDHRPGASMGKFELGNLTSGLWHACKGWIMLLTKWPHAVYLGVSQGIWGYLRDLSILIPSRLLGRNLVIHLRGSEFREFYDEMPGLLRWITRWIFGSPTRVIVLGHRLRSIFDRIAKPDLVSVIPNGIDCNQFKPAPVTEQVPANAPLRILFLASLKRRKGIYVLLNAIALVSKKIPSIRVTIAGPWRTDSEKAEGEDLVRRHSLEKNVLFTGQADDTKKKELLRTHDLLLFTPIEPEGLPWVILEAMASGLAVISSDQGAIAEVVEEGRTGRIIKPTPESVAEALSWAWEHPAEIRQMGRSGRSRAESQFSQDVYFERLIGTLRLAAE